MSEFYGWLQGNRGETTRGGSSKSGIRATIQSWKNRVTSVLMKDTDNKDLLVLTIPEGLRVTLNGKEYIIKNGLLVNDEL
jgi:hypothetical protein